jgi:hypothetical protein
MASSVFVLHLPPATASLVTNCDCTRGADGPWSVVARAAARTGRQFAGAAARTGGVGLGALVLVPRPGAASPFSVTKSGWPSLALMGR